MATYGDTDVQPMSQPPGAGGGASDVDAEYDDDEQSDENTSSTSDIEHISAEGNAADFDRLFFSQPAVLDPFHVGIDGSDALSLAGARLRFVHAGVFPFPDRFARFTRLFPPVRNKTKQTESKGIKRNSMEVFFIVSG